MNQMDELRAQRTRLQAGGGAKRAESQHAKGKLTARERLALLFDEGSFEEYGLFVRHRCASFGMEHQEVPGDGVITGCGLVNGRTVCAFAQDFTVLGGSLGECHADKIAALQDRALRMGVPIVGLLDSGGARIQEGVNALMGFGKLFYRNTISSGVIPQLSAIMGPCAGGAVYSPAITDFVLMVDSVSNMFITGPDVIQTVTGETITPDALGGALVHNAVSGVAHFLDADDAACIARIRALLACLPSNNAQAPPRLPVTDDPNRLCPQLDSIVPENTNRAYDMYDVISAIADNGALLDVQERYARNIVTCYIRLDGQVVGVVANQPRVQAGCLDVDASDKAARFIRRCDAFNTPLLTLVDVPGFLPGSGQEHAGIIRHGAKLLYAYSEATVPKLTIVTRKAYGGAYIGMCCKALGADCCYAWPTAEIAVMGAAGAANIIFKKEIALAEDPSVKRLEKITDYQSRFSGPWSAAGMGYVDDVIEPAETRLRLIHALSLCTGKREERPTKKHGNIPL